MIDDFERLRKEAVVVDSDILSGNICRGTEKTTRESPGLTSKGDIAPVHIYCRHNEEIF
jgi:hypothetical protein